jgi:SPP1 gp7 family putative phage head morphogenesis protein
MADQTDRGGFLRLGLRPRAPIAPKSIVPAPVAAPAEGKAASLLPRYYGLRSQGWSPDFIPIDGYGATIDITDGTTLAFAAYWFIATRWRAQKLAEAPLMVVEEDQQDGTEEWLADHEIVPLLDMPNADFDMGDLIEQTSRLLDNDAEALWVIDLDRAKRPGRLTPFAKSEFEVRSTADRLFGEFVITTRDGKMTLPPERVVYFRDSIAGWTDRERTRSRLDHAMAWLRLGEKARITVRDLLANSVWPSLVHTPDATWNPTKEQLDHLQEELNEYGMDGNVGKAIALLGGGSVTQLSARIRDLVPTEVLDRVESVVAAVSGVPAVVLQFQIGLENSPWSNMPTARRMAYDDTIAPTWRKWERTLTRQLLRPVDEDPTHFVRFDKSTIPALQLDRVEAATVASMMGRQASLNERRSVMGLEPLADKRANEVPELTTPDPLSLVAGGDEEDDQDEEATTDEEKAARRTRRRRTRVAALSIAFREEGVPGFEHYANRLLAQDANEIEKIVRTHLVEAKRFVPAIEQKARGQDRVMSLVLAYLKQTSEPAWARATKPLVQKAAERGTAVIAADVGISFNLLHPHVVKFAAEESAWLVKGITETTRDAVRAAIAAGIEAGKSSNDIARDVADAGAFNNSRARLIARTESTRVHTGAPTKSLQSFSKSTGRTFTKTWTTAGDARVRDEHVSMHGETVGIDEKFSNGLDHPAEPNCRCAVIFNEVIS